MAKLNANDAVQYLFDRPNEPSFNRKGPDGGVQFQVPASYVVSLYSVCAYSHISARSSRSKGVVRAGREIAGVNLIRPPVIFDGFFSQTEEYKKVANQIETRGNAPTAVYKVKEIPAKDLPDLKLALAVPRNESFSTFNEWHRTCAAQLVNALIGTWLLSHVLTNADEGAHRRKTFFFQMLRPWTISIR